MVKRGFWIDFDASRAQVFFCYGPLVIDVMPIGAFKQAFGVAAVRRLIHGVVVDAD